MPKRRADEEIYFSAIRIKCITYLDRKERNKKIQQKCMQEASTFLLLTQHYTDNKFKKNELIGHAKSTEKMRYVRYIPVRISRSNRPLG